MPSHQFKLNHHEGAACLALTCACVLCAVKRLRRLASTLANVADVAELLQRHAVLVHCSTVRDARGVPTLGPTTPLSHKQVLEAIHRLQSGRSYEAMAPPGATGLTARERPFSRQWKHPELFPGTIMLPDPKRIRPGENQIGIGDRFMYGRVATMQFLQTLPDIRTNNHTTRLVLEHINQSTQVEMSVICPFLEADENNSHNTPGGDSTSASYEQLQYSSSTKVPHNSGQPSQNVTESCQLHTKDVKPTCENKASCTLKDTSTLTEDADIKHCNTTDSKLSKMKSLSDKSHGQCDKDVPLWTVAASKIQFKALPQTVSRPIQPLADDYVLVMRLLERGFENDPDLLRAIGLAESRNRTRFKGTGSKRTRASVAIFPTPRKAGTSTNRARKPREGARRWERSSSTQRRRKPRSPKGSAGKKPPAVAARCTAYGKQCVHAPGAPARAAPAPAPGVQKRRTVHPQRPPRSSTDVLQQRAAPEKRRFPPAATPNQKQPPAPRLDARCASQVSVPARQPSKPTLASDLHRVLEASAAKTQNALKRAASDCERLSRTSTPSTNNLLKRVASDLKRISRDSMASFNNLQQERGRIGVPKAAPSQAAKLACVNNSKFQKTSKQIGSSSSSLEIKSHMPDVSDSVEQCSETQQTTAKPYAVNTLSKCNTPEAGKIVPGNPVPTTTLVEANPKPEHKNIKTNPSDGLEASKRCNNTQLAGKCTLKHPFSKMPISETNSKPTMNSEKNNPWQCQRPPESCVSVVHQNSKCIAAFGLRPPPPQTATVQKVGVRNICDGSRPLSTKATPMSQSPHLSSPPTQTKECFPQPAITKICNLPQPSNIEGKECVISTGSPPLSDIGKNDKQDIEIVETPDKSLVSPVPTTAHSATTKVSSSDSLTCQELFKADETLSSGKQSFSSFVSSTNSFFYSDTFSRSEVSSTNEKKSDYFTDNDSQRVSEKSTPSRLSSVSSNKNVPFFRKVRKIFRIRFSCCKAKLPCMRSRARDVSASSTN